MCPTYLVVCLCMFLSSCKLKVEDFVVRLVFVLVMDDFAWLELPSKLLFHLPSMLTYYSAVREVESGIAVTHTDVTRTYRNLF